MAFPEVSLTVNYRMIREFMSRWIARQIAIFVNFQNSVGGGDAAHKGDAIFGPLSLFCVCLQCCRAQKPTDSKQSGRKMNSNQLLRCKIMEGNGND